MWSWLKTKLGLKVTFKNNNVVEGYVSVKELNKLIEERSTLDLTNGLKIDKIKLIKDLVESILKELGWWKTFNASQYKIFVDDVIYVCRSLDKEINFNYKILLRPLIIGMLTDNSFRCSLLKRGDMAIN